MTNILQLPKFGNTSAFAIATNGDWLDSIYFTAPGQPAAPITMTGAITASSNSVTVTATQGLQPGLPITQVPGIPAGAYVGAISSPTVFSIVDGSGNPLDATITDAEAQLTFEPLPLDISGIAFTAQVRASATGQQVFLNLSTTAGTLVNGGANGTLSFNVPKTTIFDNVPANDYVVDIVAVADGHTISLFPEGPAALTVTAGVTQS